MTEAEWLESTHFFALLDDARNRGQGQQFRMYALFWVGQTRHLLSARHTQQVEEYRSQTSDPSRPEEHAATTWSASYSMQFDRRTAVQHAADAVAALLRNDWVSAALVAGRAAAQSRVYGPHTTTASVRYPDSIDPEQRFWDEAERLVQEQLFSLRCAFGNPFRMPICRPDWLTSTVLTLAQTIRTREDYSATPILADALQEAGCDRADVLDHCRGPGPHVRGCWVVDLVLGKE